MDQQVIICYTDLKDSTATNSAMGNQQYVPFVKDHLAVGQALAEQCTGTVIKTMGDALMLTFESFDQAVVFASRFQQYCTDQPCLDRLCLRLKIGVAVAIVDRQADGDVLGDGANLGARVQAQAQPGEVLLDERFADSLKTVWGKTKLDDFVIPAGERSLKGLEPAERLLYAFDWAKFAGIHHIESLAGVVRKHLELAHVELSEVTASDLANPGTVIWPIVPRDIPTAIHKGQAEVVRLLAMIGWRVELLITDCGAHSCSPEYSVRFREALSGYARHRGVIVDGVTLLSKLYKPEHEDYAVIQDLFQRVASSLTLRDLIDINHKEYDSDVKDEITASKTLDCLRPTLSMAAVLYLAQKEGRRCLVIAGGDERVQWETFYGVQSARQAVGVLMIPALLTPNRKHERQRKDKPSWPSRQALVRAMDQPNLAWWSFCLCAVLPAFPSGTVNIGGKAVDPQAWPADSPIPGELSPDDLSDSVWNLLGHLPAEGVRV